MSLLYPEDYRKLGYKINKSKISEKLRNEFISGIKEALKYRASIRFRTHKWVIENVVLDNEIVSNYDVKIKKRGKTILPIEVLALFSAKEILEDGEYAFKTATRKREAYYVVIKRQHNVD